MRPVFNDGHYIHASSYEFQQDVFELETRERLLSLVDSYGVVSGFGFSSVVGSTPAITISAGLAYDGTGRRVKLTSTQQSAGLSTLTGLTTSDINKIMVAENLLSGVDPEAHPLTGDIEYTKFVDVPIFSLVASGAIDASKHVRIGRIYDVTEGTSSHVAATTEGARDVLTYPTTAPFVVIGPAGDAVADYTGSNADPFNDAISAVKSATNGGIIVIRPGTYAIDPGNPIIVNGLGSIKFVGMGTGTVITNAGSTSANDEQWSVSDCEEVGFENIHFGDGAATPGAIMRIKDVIRFNFRGNTMQGDGGGANSYGLIFVSGITWVQFNQNYVEDWFWQVPINFMGENSRGVKALHVNDNHFGNATYFLMNGEIENLTFSGNHLEKNCRLSIGRRFSLGALNFSQPARTIFTKNTHLGFTSNNFSFLECAASGAIFANNTFLRDKASVCIELADVSDNAADYCIVSNNTFLDTNVSISTTFVTVKVATAGCVIRNNTFSAPNTGTDIDALWLQSPSNDCIVDGNIFHKTTFIDDGSNNWATSGVDNTSNKEL